MSEDSETGGSLRNRVTGGAIWLFGSYGLSRFGRIAMMLVVAALLSPQAYGLIGLATVIVTVVQILNEFGLWQAVVYRTDPDERFINTAFFTNLLGGLVTSSALFFAAPFIASFYGDPEMTALLRVMGLALIIDAFVYVPMGLMRKELRFRRLALPEVAGIAGAAVVTIGLLLLGFGILSYAVGFVAESLLRGGLIFIRVDWRPKLQMSWQYLKEMAPYSGNIMGGDLARHVSTNVDYFVVGRILGAGPLGYYTLAFNLANYPVSNFAYILSRLAFPTFATLQEDPERAKRVYLKMVQTVVALVVPALAMLALLAGPLILGLLGDEWRPTVFITQVMVVAGISRAISMPSSDILRATGSQAVPFRIYVLESLSILVALLLVSSRGIEAVAVSVTALMSLAAWTITIFACRKFGIRIKELGGTLSTGVVLAASGAAPVLLLRSLEVSFPSDILEFVVLAAAAGAAMIICLATVLRSFTREMLSMVGLKK